MAHIRRARPADLPRLGELAGGLVRLHHACDPRRFMLVEGVEQGYARWFAHEIERPAAVIVVAELDERIDGYAYGALEERDWNMLLDQHGAIHDVFVDPAAREKGLGRELLGTLIDALTTLGAPRIVLSTMVANEKAQRLFGALGFRPTMLEMTRERSADR